MKTIRRVMALLAVCLLLLSIPINDVRAAKPAPVAEPQGAQPASNSDPVVTGEPEGVLRTGEGADQGSLDAKGSVTVTSVWTTDGSGKKKTTFKPGDSVRYYARVVNSTGSSATASFVWSQKGPCGSTTLWSGNRSTAAGTVDWPVNATLPSNACGGSYTYTFKVTYGGASSSLSTSFVVKGNVTVTSVWTTDGSGNKKTTFKQGDSIRYYASVNNNTGGSATVSLVWSQVGPCGTTILWSGNRTTASGTVNWDLRTTIPSSACAGSYTYTVKVTHSGESSSKSTSFVVKGYVKASSAWTTDASGNVQDTFAPGDSILYYGSVLNTTGRTATANVVWSQSGPCDSKTIWSGNRSPSNGTVTWNVGGFLPKGDACTGPYTYTFRVTYDGASTSQTATFYVQLAGKG
jgi:hypothetical protein